MAGINKRMVPLFTEEIGVPDRRVLECKELLLPEEAADILRVSRATIYSMVAAGELEGVKVRTSVRVTTGSVRRWLCGEIDA